MAASRQTRLPEIARWIQSTRAHRAAFAGALAMLGSAVFAGGPAHAEANCDVRKSLIAKLSNGYAEQPVAIGLASTGNVVELLISTEGTWTILVTRPNGIACVAAVGRDWQPVKRELAGEQS